MQVQTAAIQSIPLKLLHASDRNARRVQKPVDDLVASIRAHGLQHNLVVWPHEDGHGYEVIAGDRRRRALVALQAAGELSEDDLVDCRVLPLNASPEEISLAENVGREDMHPADEFLAFRHLIDTDGLTSADVAARFGKSDLYVAQRLKLASVSPKILDQFRKDEIKLASVMALAITEDHAAQERVWAVALKQGEWAQKPENLLRELTSKELDLSRDTIAKFVGLADYEKGGGVARRDLFSEAIYLPDAKLARALAKEKLDKTAKKIRAEGWSWVEVRLEFDYSEKSKFVEESGSFKDGKRIWSDKVKAYAGAVVALNSYSGKVEITRGLARPADKKKAAAAAPAKGKAAPARTAAAKPAKKQGELSFAQIQRLQGQRTAVLRVELATKPRVALAALAADLAKSELLAKTGLGSMLKNNWYDAGSSIVHIAGDRHVANVNIRQGIDEHPAAEQLDKLEADWIKRLKPAKDDLFAWLLKEPESTTLELLAYLASQAIVAGENFDKKSDQGAKFAAAAGIDMAKHWTPTVEWLQAQPKGVLVAAVTEAVGKKQAAEIEKLKKGDAATRAEQLLAGTGWIPKPLRAPAPKKAKG